jgi:hypothetical protein
MLVQLSIASIVGRGRPAHRPCRAVQSRGANNSGFGYAARLKGEVQEIWGTDEDIIICNTWLQRWDRMHIAVQLEVETQFSLAVRVLRRVCRDGGGRLLFRRMSARQ